MGSRNMPSFVGVPEKEEVFAGSCPTECHGAAGRIIRCSCSVVLPQYRSE